MMQAILQRQLGDGFVVESAGINRGSAGQPANPYSISCMKTRRMDISNHISRWVGDLHLGDYAHIVCVGENERMHVVDMLDDRNTYTEVIVANEKNGGIPNPYELGWNAYQQCASTLARVMPKVARGIRQAA